MKIYKHKDTLDRVTIKKLHGDVASCNLIDLPKTNNISGRLVYQVIICNVSNLIEQSKPENYSLFAHNC